MKIIINGESVEASDLVEISYDLVNRIAFNGKADRTPSITFKRAAPPKTEGTLLPGETVNIVEGTIFNVYVTGGA